MQLWVWGKSNGLCLHRGIQTEDQVGDKEMGEGLLSSTIPLGKVGLMSLAAMNFKLFLCHMESNCSVVGTRLGFECCKLGDLRLLSEKHIERDRVWGGGGRGHLAFQLGKREGQGPW